MLQKHKAFIENGLTGSTAGRDVRAKYEWLRDYHNYFCTTQLSWDPVEWSGPPEGSTDSLLIDPPSSRLDRFRPVADGNPYGLTGKMRFPLCLPDLG